MRSSIPVDNEGKITVHSQVRRFDVRTFAFLDPNTGYHSTEPVRLHFFFFRLHIKATFLNMHILRCISIVGLKSVLKTWIVLNTALFLVSIFLFLTILVDCIKLELALQLRRVREKEEKPYTCLIIFTYFLWRPWW